MNYTPFLAVLLAATPVRAQYLSPHFTLDELTRSATASRRAIDNTPPDAEVIENLRKLACSVLEPARMQLGMPVMVNSGYRSPELNRAVGGVPRSYHLYGRAADITTGSIYGNRRLWEILRRLPHTELIWERGGLWIHVAL